MNDNDTSTAMVPVSGRSLNKTNQTLAIRQAKDAASGYVPHLNFGDIKRLVEAVQTRHPARDRLLIKVAFDGCFRVSELISIRPCDIQPARHGGYLVRVLGKGRKRSTVAITTTTVSDVFAYCYAYDIEREARIFHITRSRAWQIIAATMARAGIEKPAGVGACHVLRHSGALERLRRTGNPQAVKEQLRHNTVGTTMRYMRTLSHDAALQIQNEVDYEW